MKHHFAILLILAFALPILHGADDAVLNLWSGKSYDFPGNGKWQIVAKHGRVLASGDGRMRLLFEREAAICHTRSSRGIT